MTDPVQNTAFYTHVYTLHIPVCEFCNASIVLDFIGELVATSRYPTIITGLRHVCQSHCRHITRPIN